MAGISERGTVGSNPPASPSVRTPYDTSIPASAHRAMVRADPPVAGCGRVPGERLAEHGGSPGDGGALDDRAIPAIDDAVAIDVGGHHTTGARGLVSGTAGGGAGQVTRGGHRGPVAIILR